MRIVIVALLLFFNVAFALWMTYGDGPKSGNTAIPATDPGVASLELLPARDRAAAAVPPPRSVDSPATRPSTAAQPDPEPGPVSAPQQRVVQAPMETPLASAPGQCRVVGPYAERRDARAAAAHIVAQGMAASVTEASVVERRYWVYLPPFVSRSAAFEGERELRAKGIEDLQVLAGDDKENGISLGLYRERSAAERRLRQLRGLGYAPEMTALERSRSYFWIEVPLAGDATESPAWLDRLLEASRQVEIRACGGEQVP